MTAKIRNRKSGFFIGVTCPGCGGELELEENFFVTRCCHCDSVHRIVMPDIPMVYLIPAKISKREARFSIDRYLKKKSLPLTCSNFQLKRLYYPYWKIDAVLLKIRNKRYKKVVADAGEYNDEISYNQERTEINLTPYTTTMAAGIYFDGIPATVGMRTEYIKLIPYAEDNILENFDCLPVLKGWEEVRLQVIRNVVNLGMIDIADFGSNKTELFSPKALLVYFPYFVFESYSRGDYNRYIVDGVTGRFLNHITKLNVDEQSLTINAPEFEFGALEIKPHRCTNCGIDLPSEQSYVYICSNCHTIHCLENYPGTIDEIFVANSTDRPNDRLFPFWSFKIPVETAGALKSMFGGIYSSDRLVIPAFKMPNFNALFRLAKRMSAASPQLDLIPLESMDNRFMPANISMSEAIMHVEIIIYREVYSKKFSSSKKIPKFQPVEVSLFYAPFHPENYFYVDSILNAITFEKNLAF